MSSEIERGGKPFQAADYLKVMISGVEQERKMGEFSPGIAGVHEQISQAAMGWINSPASEKTFYFGWVDVMTGSDLLLVTRIHREISRARRKAEQARVNLGESSFFDKVSAVTKAGKQLGPAYMLDPERDAALAVMDDETSANKLSQSRTALPIITPVPLSQEHLE